MTANFNRGFPLQPFRLFGSPSGNVPPIGETSTGSTTASVVFTATATGTSTRTASATVSVAFTATATGQLVIPGNGIGIPPESPVQGNVVGVGTAILRSSVVW
jgi:hypothetical protein